MERQGAIINLDTKYFIVGGNKANLLPRKNNSITIPGRSEVFVQAIAMSPTDNYFEGIYEARELKPNIFIGTCLTKIVNQKGTISVLNISEDDVSIETPIVKFEKYAAGENLENSLTIETNKDRLNIIKNSLRLNHLNWEESEIV